MSEWIKCGEKSAPIDVGLLIYSPEYGRDIAWFCPIRGHWQGNEGEYVEQPTHWMPLPEPPKDKP